LFVLQLPGARNVVYQPRDKPQADNTTHARAPIAGRARVY